MGDKTGLFLFVLIQVILDLIYDLSWLIDPWHIVVLGEVDSSVHPETERELKGRKGVN